MAQVRRGPYTTPDEQQEEVDAVHFATRFQSGVGRGSARVRRPRRGVPEGSLLYFNPVSITLWCVVLTSDCLHQSLYQDRKELLEADAQKLSLTAVTKDGRRCRETLISFQTQTLVAIGVLQFDRRRESICASAKSKCIRQARHWLPS